MFLKLKGETFYEGYMELDTNHRYSVRRIYWLVYRRGRWLLYALIILVVADYITGVMCAIADKELSSEIGYRGIFKKVLIFILVGVGHMIDTHLIGDGSVLRTAVIFFYCSNEGISMLENASRLGLPIPEKLKNVLAQLHNKGGNEQ